jgi:hypothetical protein
MADPNPSARATCAFGFVQRRLANGASLNSRAVPCVRFPLHETPLPEQVLLFSMCPPRGQDHKQTFFILYASLLGRNSPVTQARIQYASRSVESPISDVVTRSRRNLRVRLMLRSERTLSMIEHLPKQLEA